MHDCSISSISDIFHYKRCSLSRVNVMLLATAQGSGSCQLAFVTQAHSLSKAGPSRSLRALEQAVVPAHAGLTRQSALSAIDPDGTLMHTSASDASAPDFKEKAWLRARRWRHVPTLAACRLELKTALHLSCSYLFAALRAAS